MADPHSPTSKEREAGVLGIIAAAGPEPGQVLAACRARNRQVFVLALEGYADPVLVEGLNHAWVRLGAGGQMLKLLRKAGATEIVFTGVIEDFSLKSLRPDLWTTLFMARHGMSLLQDERQLLKQIAADLEKREGFRVIDAKTLLSA